MVTSIPVLTGATMKIVINAEVKIRRSCVGDVKTVMEKRESD